MVEVVDGDAVAAAVGAAGLEEPQQLVEGDAAVVVGVQTGEQLVKHLKEGKLFISYLFQCFTLANVEGLGNRLTLL